MNTYAARNKWIADNLPLRVRALEVADKSLTSGFDDMRVTPALLDAYRSGDDAELGRIVRDAVRAALADDADLDLEEEAAARFEEAA